MGCAGSSSSSTLRELARLCPVVGGQVGPAGDAERPAAPSTPLTEALSRELGAAPHPNMDAVDAFLAQGGAPNMCPFARGRAAEEPPARAPAPPQQDEAVAPAATPDQYEARFQQLIDKKKATNTYRVFKQINRCET
mgnify:CR=1 FL=1